MVEVIGWIASGFIVASLSMKSILKLRLLGLVGAVTFATYGVLLQAWPIAAVNTTIVGIHLWFLRRLLGEPASSFRLLEVRADSDYLRSFLEFYRGDVERFAPGFEYSAHPGQEQWFILRDMVPAGLLIGTWTDGPTLSVDLDFAIPQYRDLRLGRFAYSHESGLFEGRQTVTVVAWAATETHADYLRRIGFAETSPGSFVKAIG